MTDTTEFSLFGQKMYLSPALDSHNSYLVGYTLSDQSALDMAPPMLEKAHTSIPDEIELIFQQVVHQENCEYGPNGNQAAADQFIEIITSGKSIQFLDEKVIIASLPHAIVSDVSETVAVRK